MKIVLAAIALSLMPLSTALAFDATTAAVIAGQKIGKPVAIADVAALMEGSARWCYVEDAGSCAWTDVYLAVTTEGAEYEIGNAWDDSVDIALIDHGRLGFDGALAALVAQTSPHKLVNTVFATPVSEATLADALPGLTLRPVDDPARVSLSVPRE